MLNAESNRRYRERKCANANINVNLYQSNISNRVDRDLDEHPKMNQSFRKGNEIHQLRLGIDLLLMLI